MISQTRVLVTAVALTAAIAAQAPAAVQESARGVVGSVEVRYPPPGLAAKPVMEPDAPMLVRVTHIREDRYKIDYLGLLSGEYDLAPLLQQSDGRPASSLAPLAVRVSTQLPPGHGTDVFGLESPRVSIVSRYEALAGIAISLWIAAPIVAISLRALRRKPTVIVPPPPTQPTATEMLRDAVRRAQGRDLTTDERARLELLLFRALTEARDGASTASADVSRAIAALRSDPHTEGVVLAVERWLHAEQPEGAEAALRALDAHTRNPAGAGA